MSFWSRPVAPSRRASVYWTRADGVDLRADGFLMQGLRDGHYVLRHAELVTGVHDRDAMAGELEIPARLVSFVQILGAAE